VLCHVFQKGARFCFVSVARQVADRVEVMERERPEVIFAYSQIVSLPGKPMKKVSG
jgi:hypothetical protein